MAAPKDIVYIDVDEEITGIIDKVQAAKEKIVALVLPKRAAVLQSVVNMKLLKKSADEAKKNIVLITSDANLLPLAGSVGFYVAKTLQTRPVVPPAPLAADDTPLSVNEDAALDEEALDTTLPVGALAGLPPDEDEEIEVDNADDAVEEETAAAATAVAAETKKFNKKLKVPNFERFRLVLILGALLITVLAVALYYAMTALPKASITIKTDTTTVNSDVTFTASTTAQTVDTVGLVLPATQKQDPKSDKQQVPTTGQVDQGTKAAGTMTLTNCINDGQPHTVPAGTGFSSGQFTFVTTQDVTLAASYYQSGSCKTQFGTTLGFTKDVSVTATQAGDAYNLSARNYNSSITGISASGSAMSGGTSKIIKVVAQADIDNAKQKIMDADAAVAANELKQQFQADNGLALSDTLAAGTPTVTTSANVGDQADQVTVTVATTYTMVGITKSNLSQLIKADVSKHIDVTKQKISSDGVDQAVLKVLDKAKPTAIRVEEQTTATAGAEQNADTIKQLVAGRKAGDAKDTISSRPGIKDVNVKLSPFWVTSIPKKPAKVTVTFISANGK